MRNCFLFSAFLLLCTPTFADDTNESGSLSSKASQLWKKGKEATMKGADVVADKSTEAWDATKGVSKEAWEATKDKSGEVAETTSEVTKEGWNKTKEASEDGWNATKNASKKVLDFTAGTLQKASDAITSDEDQAEADDKVKPEVVDRSVN